MDACRGMEGEAILFVQRQLKSEVFFLFPMLCSIQHLELLSAVYNAGLIPNDLFEVKMKKLT
jgi:hypothetical protein